MDMHELTRSLEALAETLKQLRVLLRLEEKQVQVGQLEQEVSNPDLWKDQEEATRKTKLLSSLKEETHTWEKLTKDVSDLLEMARMDELDREVNLREEIEAQYTKLAGEIQHLEFYTLFSGKHDEKGAIVSIHAGVGGTEAQDWAEMLLRMVMRYAEKKGWRVEMLDESRGTEAGIKSVTFRVDGRFAYGHLQSEHGTHRLVRQSPFNADALRQTSFALIEVIPEVDFDTEVVIDPKDLRIDTFMAGGHGGQSVNTTYSAVRIVHIPTNTTVQCQNERSQLQNKQTAMKILHSKLLRMKEEEEEKERLKLRGEYKSAEWGNQIRSYVLHPYKMVKDLRTKYETSDPDDVLNGNLDPLVEAYVRWKKS